MGNVADLVAALRRIEVATRHVVLAREQDSIELRGQFAGMLADEALIIRDKYDIGLLHYNMAKVVAELWPEVGDGVTG